MGTYGTPPATRTDSGSGQLIVPPRHVLYTKTCVEQASKLVGQIVKETFYPVYLVPGPPHRRLLAQSGPRFCHLARSSQLPVPSILFLLRSSRWRLHAVGPL